MIKIKNSLLYSTLFLTVMALDRFTKWYALHYFKSCVYVNSFLSYELVFNRGISWGLFNSEETVIFCLVSAVNASIIALFAWYVFRRLRFGNVVVYEVVVLAGALSNLIDRAVYGGVVDFILLSYHEFFWPYFNIADCCIVLGIMGMWVRILREEY